MYIKGPTSTFGDLTINNAGLSGQNTVLPSLGSGVAATASNGTIAVNNVPDHVHLLTGLQPDLALSDLVRDIKAGSSGFVT